MGATRDSLQAIEAVSRGLEHFFDINRGGEPVLGSAGKHFEQALATRAWTPWDNFKSAIVTCS